MIEILVQPHPRLDLQGFVARWAEPIGALNSPPWLTALLGLAAPAPVSPDDSVREAVRQLLREGGYKPAGRGKPASEYLRGVAEKQRLTSINLVVDLCNAVSLHSRLPISVIDLQRATPPLRVGVVEDDLAYVFNNSGQEIRLRGLLSLHDAQGPCAGPVKDSQRTKTGPNTRDVLCLLWATKAAPGLGLATIDWYRALSERAGATIDEIRLTLTAHSSVSTC